MSTPRRPKSSPNAKNPLEHSKPDRMPAARATEPEDDEFALEEEDARTTHLRPAAATAPAGPEEVAPDAAEDEEATASEYESATLEDEEFSAGTDEVALKRARREEAALPSVRQSGNPQLDRVGRIAGMLLVPLIFVGIFYTILQKRPVASKPIAKAKPDLPVDGKLVKITEITTGWRDRTEDDRVKPEAQLLSKTTVYPSKLPELRLKLTSSAPNAFLRVLFHRSDDKIAGDPKVIKVVNGKIQPLASSGDKLLGDLECSVAASTGLQTTRHLEDYLRGDQPRWSVEISESADSQAKDEDWKLLESFAIADARF